jgi:glycosyltransferase involved in cell wall biosynthesis
VGDAKEIAGEANVSGKAPRDRVHREVVGILAPTFPPAFRSGGPSRSLDSLVSTIPERFVPFVLTSDRDHGRKDPMAVVANAWTARGNASIRYTTLNAPKKIASALVALRGLRPSILYFNSFFNVPLTALPQLLFRFGFWGRPTRLLAPRGEFGPGALRRHPIRKRIYVALFRACRLDRGIVWHATAETEAQDIRRMWGAKADVIVRENETFLPRQARPPKDSASKIRAAFVGRLVEHKGLAILLEALSHHAGPFELDIYGLEEDPAYVSRCKRLAAQLPNNIRLNMHGVIAPDEVVERLAEHDVLLMPTAGENFGHVIAEALSVSCVVFTPPTTPWTDVLQDGGGKVVRDRSVGAWEEALAELQLCAAVLPDMRRSAGDVYTRWANRPKPEHLLTLVSIDRR